MDSKSIETATLGGGCFWCLEAAYQEIEGVIQVVSGYAGGVVADPSYETVLGGQTGHAEVVQVHFDTATISYSDVLDVFWAIHNPTTLNQQGNDIGTQYRSIILYDGDTQKNASQVSRDKIANLWDNEVITEIKPLEAFYPAEDYHQNYFRTNPQRAYCQAVINPKLAHLRQVFAGRLKRP